MTRRAGRPTYVPLRSSDDGLAAHSQNRWPNLAQDFGRINDCLSRFFPAGFYYKTFMWPRGGVEDALTSPSIRRAAGLG